jgi:hypothetical protein
MISRSLILISLIFAVIFGVQCTKNALEPRLDPQVINQTDLFEFKIVDVRSINRQLVYRWQNNGITANIFNGSVVTMGNGSIRITDIGGSEVFSENLGASGNFFSSSGESGKWMIELNLSNVSGTVHVRVQRRF